MANNVDPTPATCKLHGDYYHKQVPGPESDNGEHACWVPFPIEKGTTH